MAAFCLGDLVILNRLSGTGFGQAACRMRLGMERCYGSSDCPTVPMLCPEIRPSPDWEMLAQAQGRQQTETPQGGSLLAMTSASAQALFCL